MTTKELTQEVEEWIAKHEPVDQDKLVEKFGRRGLASLRDLMEANRVSYNLEWDLQTEGPNVESRDVPTVSVTSDPYTNMRHGTDEGESTSDL